MKIPFPHKVYSYNSPSQIDLADQVLFFFKVTSQTKYVSQIKTVSARQLILQKTISQTSEFQRQ
jgi:hypothetical protein